MRAKHALLIAGALGAPAVLAVHVAADPGSPNGPADCTIDGAEYVDGALTFTARCKPHQTTTTTEATPSTSSTVAASTTTTSLPSTTSTVTPTTAAPTTVAATSTTSTSPPATTTTAPPAGAGDFVEDFSTPAALDRFQFETSFGTQSGAVAAGGGDWLGDHNTACGAPTTTRTVDGTKPAEMVWYCAPNGPATGHLMTATASVGYAQVAFSPRRSFTDVRRICWDQNFTEMGGRKWTQMVIVPEADYQKNGQHLRYAEQGLMPSPASGFLSVGGGGLLVRVQGGTTSLLTTTGPSGPTFGPDAIPTAPDQYHDIDGYSSGLMTGDKATRYTQCLTETAQGARVDKDTPLGPRTGTVTGVHIPQGQVRVIFQDDTYDNYKGGLGDATHGDDPRVTWHWDSVVVDVA